MYTTKQAILAIEHLPGVECHVFFMDFRAFGKGYDAYYHSAKGQVVNYSRCRIYSLKGVPATRSLMATYQTELGELRKEDR